MAEIEPAWDFLMDLEGGDLMHEVQGDPGGRTRFGISEKFHPEMWEDGPPDEPSARDFYRRVYWAPLRLGELESQEMADEVLEFAVNASTPERGKANVAVRTAQEAANDVRKRKDMPRIAEDGLIGPQTIRALNAFGSYTVDAMAWDGRFNLRQLRYYYTRDRDLITRFFHGWTRRVWQ